MNRRTRSLVAAMLTIAIVPAAAQWLNVPAKGIPRTRDGKPDLSAPAPRKPDGKPDLSGIWLNTFTKYGENLLADFKPGELPIQPWAEALTKERTAGLAADLPSARCLPHGVPLIEFTANITPLKIIQESNLVVILYEAHGQFRQIFLDGRTLPSDPESHLVGLFSWPLGRGYISGRDSRFQWQDLARRGGPPATDALHVTERFRRPDFGHLDNQITIDDPKAYTKPWSIDLPIHLFPDTELLEYVCNENEKDVQHMVDK